MLTNLLTNGTRIDKALFDSIKGDVYRVDRYSIPTFSQATSLANKHKTGVYIALWGNSHYSKYGITVSANSEDDDNYAYKAMNGVSGYWASGSVPTVATPAVFTIQLDKEIILKKYKISGSSSLYCKEFTLQGSMDGENYLDIQSVTGNTATETEYSPNNNEFYKYYRLSITASNSSSDLAAILEFNITDWYEKEYYNKIALNDITLTSYENSQRLMLDLTDNPTTEFTSNIFPPFKATSQDGYLIQSSGDYLGTSVIDAFDHDDTYTAWRSLETQASRYIQIQTPINIIPNRVSMKIANVSSGKFQGSNDGDNWDDLTTNIATTDGTTTETKTYDINTTTKYRYFRFIFSAYTSGTSSYIYALEVTIGYISGFNYNNSSYININSLGDRAISNEDAIIDDGNYELVYNSTSNEYMAYFNSFSRATIENTFTAAEKVKLAGIEVGAEVNIIDGFKLNGTEILPDANRVVSFNNVERDTNKVTSLSNASTDTEYPSAKCVYDIIGDVESLLSSI